jgi:NADH-quinone oxidoreductase subunit C
MNEISQNNNPDTVSSLQERFSEIEICEICGEPSIIVPPMQIVDVCKALRDDFDFELLVEETAVDYWPQETPRFHVVYGVRSLQKNQFLMLRVPLEGNAPSLPTIESVYANANWFEREIWDMFGIRFDNHSDLRRILMPADWQGHPLRKDYPLGYEEVQFSFNFDEIDRKKSYAKE